ncbi:hypothetical protein A2U01_0084174, partial [Trifolium medium]|nr:hypothetical protein [Trifolium medium]
MLKEQTYCPHAKKRRKLEVDDLIVRCLCDTKLDSYTFRQTMNLADIGPLTTNFATHMRIVVKLKMTLVP